MEVDVDELKQRILQDGKNLGGGILKVDSFVNHQVDPLLMDACGREFARRFASVGATKVLTAEKVPNSRKLVKLTIDAGAEQRTLVAGIAEAYEPDALVGRTIVMVFNLKPAKLMGIESNGMVLAASPDGGKPALVGFDSDIAPGTRVR